MAIKQVRGHSISVGDMFSTKDVFPSLLGTLFLTGMATAFASLLCYVPALIVGGLLMLAVPLVVDQNLGPTEAMSRSWNALKGDMWNATGFYFLTSLIGGLFAPVTFPLLMLSHAIVYRDFILTPQIPQQPMEYGTYPNNYPPPQG